MNLHFIINPAAKNGKSLKIWKRIEQKLIERKIRYRSYFTQKRGDGKKLARKIVKGRESFSYIIAVGGDGTIHEVLNGISPFDRGIVGYIPAGSGNDFSRGYYIPNDPDQALEYVLALIGDEPILVDVGKFQGVGENNGYFINNFGCGFDAKIAVSANESKLKPFLNRFGLGKFVYVYFLIKELFRHRPMTINLDIDERREVFERAWFLTVSNQPYYGGGMKISPGSHPIDGQLEVIVVHGISKLKILMLFMTVFWGKHIYMKEVKILQGKRIRIRTDLPSLLHADGEYAGVGNVDIEIVPRALSLLTRCPLTDQNLPAMNESER
ncbi:diacylglycerol/lipid kinase family protein [Fervidibacillus halotolerans]|uniref:Diacylglycerol kinase family lipid kinase n=1 Tax=Fervidibacillus halotolerans TaxID=2980027 RepID=A0A9E8RY13_9BACI|nr:diacylglycerol kinase family protein [Fervidibacillus halotolerans]WAA11759.1 diacylglycerol kinase family lipid kinase [Fervidibacillus halotolerans]